MGVPDPSEGGKLILFGKEEMLFGVFLDHFDPR